MKKTETLNLRETVGIFQGGKKYARGINQIVPIDPFTPVGVKWQLKDFTLGEG